MFTGIECSKCKGLLLFDEQATINLYNEKLIYKLQDVDTVVESEISKRLVFTCKKCKNQEYLMYSEWEKRARKYLTEKMLKVRTARLLAKYRARGVNEASGIAYCGGCFGYGGDGWCLKDIIKQCEIGKRKYDEL